MIPPAEMGVADAPPARPGWLAVLRAEWHRWRARSGLERAIAIVDRVRHHQFCADRLDPPLQRRDRPGASDG